MLSGSLIGWERHDVERRQRRATHRIDIGERVRGGHAAEGVRIVDDGRKEVHRLDQREVVGQAKDAGVVERLPADEQPWIRRRGQRSEHLRQVTRTHF